MKELLKWWIPGFTIQDMQLISSYHDCFTSRCQNKSVESKADHQHSHHFSLLILYLFAVDYLSWTCVLSIFITQCLEYYEMRRNVQLRPQRQYFLLREIINPQKIDLHFLKKGTKQLIRNEGTFEGLLPTLHCITVGHRFSLSCTWWRWHHRSVCRY